jgi:tetratricopeptide (TPR) repeat protein
MFKSIKSLLIASLIIIFVIGCSNNSYDYKLLGFSSAEEMQISFSKGYHNKNKYTEMMGILNNNTPPVENSSKLNEVTVSIPKIENTPTKVEGTDFSCSNLTTCVDAMLNAAKVENISIVLETARRIETFEKPERGDRKIARKLNEQGLLAFKNDNKSEAISILTSARNTDKLDEEIISNLVYVYSENENYLKAIELAKEGFLLNPRRASLWLPYAESNQKAGNKTVALSAFWLAWQFSGNKEKMLESMEKKISDEKNLKVKELYISGKSWVIDNKKPSF